MLSCSCLTRCFNRPALLEKTLRAKVDFSHCPSGAQVFFFFFFFFCFFFCFFFFVFLISAHVAQVEMSRGTLTSLSQTGECFLLTFDLGRQDVNNKNNHGIGQTNHGPTTEWTNHGARPQKLQTTSWNVLLRLVAGLRRCWHVD